MPQRELLKILDGQDWMSAKDIAKKSKFSISSVRACLRRFREREDVKFKLTNREIHYKTEPKDDHTT